MTTIVFVKETQGSGLNTSALYQVLVSLSKILGYGTYHVAGLECWLIESSWSHRLAVKEKAKPCF